jgi:hypothetical protein
MIFRVSQRFDETRVIAAHKAPVVPAIDLDGDHGLVGEGLEQGDLLFRELSWLVATDGASEQIECSGSLGF